MSDFKSNNSSEFIAAGGLVHGYTVIPNQIMNDIPNITSDGFTVLAKIFQYINNPQHKISIQGLSTQTGLSKDRTSKALKKLIEAGYIIRTPKKRGNLIAGYLYQVYDKPQNETVENTTSCRNPGIQDTKIQDTKIQDTKIQDTNIQDANKENNNKENNNKENNNIYKLIPCPKSSDTVKPDTVKPDTKNNSIKNNSVKNNNNIKKEKETNLDKLIKEYTDNEELKETLKDFIKMRKTIKKPVTDRALKGILNKLDNLSNNNQIKIEILEQSIEKCWVGVFPLKENKKYSTNNISQPTNSIPKQQQFIPHYNLPGENRVGVRVHETFRDYDPNELEKMLLESQKGKF